MFTNQTAFDPSLEGGKSYLYALSAYDSMKTPRESPKIYSRTFRPHATPRIDTAMYVQGGQIQISTSEDMGTIIPSISAFLLDGTKNPESVVLLDAHTLLLSFTALSDGTHGLTVNQLRDAEGIPFDERMGVTIDVLKMQETECFIRRVSFLPPRSFDVHFNLPVEKLSAENAMNYDFQPIGTASKAVLDSEDQHIVHLELGRGTAIGAIGKEYVLKVSNVQCSSGALITEGAGGTAGVILNRQTLDEIFVYPNPWTEGDGQDYITFANLTQRATIRIYSVSGLFVNEVQETDGNGGAEWNLVDKQGNRIPAGVYFYYATGFDSAGRAVDAKKGKFAIAR